MTGPASLLGVDVGSNFTKAALFEAIEGRYRLVGRSQARTSAGNHVYDGLERACAHIAQVAGRELFAGGEPLAGDVSPGRGVDELAVTVSCFRPLRVLATDPQAAAAARSERCRVHLLTGRTLAEEVDSAASGAWDAVAGRERDVERALLLLGVGPRRLQSLDAQPGTERSGPTVRVVTGQTGDIGRQLRELALERALEELPGLPDLASAATQPLESSAGGLGELTRLIASRFGLRLAIADCGSTQTAISRATPTELSTRVLLHPRALTDIPVTEAGISAMHDALQDLLAGCAEQELTADVIVATGALARCGSWSTPALTLLNGIRPAGVVQLALDAAGIVGPLSSLARAFPEAASEVFERHALTGLGAAVCPRGSLRAGAKAVDVRWRVGDRPDQQRLIKAGELVRLAVPPGERVSLTLHPSREVDVGLGRPGVAASATVDGGRVGLIVDAREAAAKSQRRPWEAALA